LVKSVAKATEHEKNTTKKDEAPESPEKVVVVEEATI